MRRVLTPCVCVRRGRNTRSTNRLWETFWQSESIIYLFQFFFNFFRFWNKAATLSHDHYQGGPLYTREDITDQPFACGLLF